MGIDTKGFVLTEEFDFIVVVKAVGDAIYTLIEPELKKALNLTGESSAVRTHYLMSRGSTQWKLPELYFNPKFGSPSPADRCAWYNFRYKGESRSLFLYFEPETSDFEGYDFPQGSKGWILSLSMWGCSVEIVERILLAIASKGYEDVYLMESDCERDLRRLLPIASNPEQETIP